MFWHILLLLACFLTLHGINVALFVSFFPKSLHMNSPIIGVPLYGDYNIDLIFYAHYVAYLLVPIASWFLYLDLRRRLALAPFPAVVGRCERSEAGPRSETPPLRAQRSSADGRWIRSFTVGFFFSRIFYINGFSFLGWQLCGAFLYVFLVKAAAKALGKSTQSSAWWTSALNLLGTSCLFLGFSRLSNQTGIAILDGKQITVDWFPTWLGISLSAATLLYIVTIFFDRGFKLVSPETLQEREKSILLTLVAPLLFFLSLPRPYGQHLKQDMDFFHQGEGIVSGSLLYLGKIPWKDFLFVHGLMDDVLVRVVGMFAWGPTVWGSSNGFTIWVVMAGALLLGLLYQKLFRSNLVYLLLIALATQVPIRALGEPMMYRFLLAPLALYLLILYLENPSIPRVGFLSFVAVLHIFVTAEALFWGLALGAAAIFADIQEQRGSKFSLQKFKFTWPFFLASLSFVAVGFLVLLYFDALGPYLDFHLKTASKHRYSGGLSSFRFIGDTPFILLTITMASSIWFFLSRWQRKEKLTPVETAMFGAGVFSVLYFQKFLSRADYSHMFHFWIASIVLFYYFFFRFVGWLEYRIRGSHPSGPASHPVCWVLISLLVFFRWGDLSKILFPPTAPVALATNSIEPRLGPLNMNDEVAGIFKDLRGYFEKEKFTGPLFDFTNQPFLTHHMLGFPPATRFPYVSLSINPILQNDLIKELRAYRPEYVDFYALKNALGRWDGIENQVRHYLVGQYILENYRPVKWVAGNLILKRRDLVKEEIKDLYRDLPTCDWGYILSHWSRPFTKESAAKGTETFLTQNNGQYFTTEIPVPQRVAGHAASLELLLDETSEDLMQIQMPTGNMEWLTHAMEGIRFRIPVGSCPHWYSVKNGMLKLNHSQPLKLRSVRWIPQAVSAYEP